MYHIHEGQSGDADVEQKPQDRPPMLVEES